MTVHIDRLVDDYVLDLLTSADRRQVEQHVASCSRCLALLAGEQARAERLTAAWRQSAAAPPERLAALWPGISAAVAARVDRPSALRGVTRWSQWRMALATFAVVLLALVGLWGTGRRLDGWLLATFTPTVAVGTASPTASSTPTALAPAATPDRLSEAIVAFRPASVGTPDPVQVNHTPQPRPIPVAPLSAW